MLTAEEINNSIVADEYKKQLMHYFAAAVVRTCAVINTKDIGTGYAQEVAELCAFSQGHAPEHCITPITKKDDLLKYLFEKETAVPLYVWYWLEMYHRSGIGNIIKYKTKSSETVNELRSLYIEQKRLDRINKQFDFVAEKLRRRKICKMYKDGACSELFKIHNETADKELFTSTELENISVILFSLFPKEMQLHGSVGNDAAFAYCLGRMQGRAEKTPHAAVIANKKER